MGLHDAYGGAKYSLSSDKSNKEVLVNAAIC